MNGLISALFAVFFWIYLNKVQKIQGKFHVEKKKADTDRRNNWNLMSNSILSITSFIVHAVFNRDPVMRSAKAS